MLFLFVELEVFDLFELPLLELLFVVFLFVLPLPDDYRTVIILRDIQGLSYDEIAEIIECSVGTVKSRISRGRRNLREILSKDRELFDKYFV